MAIEAMNCVITSAGLAAAVDASAGGLRLELTHIALGDGAAVPDTSAVALAGEQERVEIASFEETDPAVLEMTAIVESAATYTVRELGLFAADGTLVAIAHRSGGILQKAAHVRYVISFTLPLASLPAESLTVAATASLDLAFIGPIAALTRSVAALTIRQVEQEIRLRALEHRQTGGMETIL